MIAGDFNSKFGNWGSYGSDEHDFDYKKVVPQMSLESSVDHMGVQLSDLFDTFGFSIMYAKADDGKTALPTLRNSKSVLDVFFLGGFKETHCEIVDSPFSDHYQVKARVKFSSDRNYLPLPPGTDDGFHEIIKNFVDYSKIAEIEIPDEFKNLLLAPGLTSDQALALINDFVLTYSKQSKKKTVVEPKIIKEMKKDVRRTRKLLNRDPSNFSMIQCHERTLATLEFNERRLEREKMLAKWRSAYLKKKSGDMKRYWDTIKSVIPSNNRVKLGGIVDRQEVEQFFKSVYYDENIPPLKYSFRSFLHSFDATTLAAESPISVEEVKAAIFERKPSKSPGVDGISIDLYRILMFDENFLHPIARFFNFLYFGDSFPEEWNKAAISLLYKGKGEISNPESYRGISLTASLLKIYEAVITRRLNAFLENENVVSKFQSAFRPSRGVDEQIYILDLLIHTSFRRKRKLYACTIDLSKAFPPVCREILFESLLRKRVPPLIIRSLINMYSDSSFTVMVDGKFGEFFPANKGVREGSISSPVLFTLMFDEVVRYVESCPNDAPKIGNESYPVLLYADDIILISESFQGLQNMVSAVENFCRLYKFNINSAKCEFIVFERSRCKSKLNAQKHYFQGDSPQQVVQQHQQPGPSALLDDVTAVSMVVEVVRCHFRLLAVDVSQHLHPIGFSHVWVSRRFVPHFCESRH